mmetsp:Transcript_38340/g.105622  ORF Transcript_38340/g.105622 Transcript_38340/m.105622 type:complete len:220 (+) Transcript_38340:695-1354(+)
MTTPWPGEATGGGPAVRCFPKAALRCLRKKSRRLPSELKASLPPSDVLSSPLSPALCSGPSSEASVGPLSGTSVLPLLNPPSRPSPAVCAGALIWAPFLPSDDLSPSSAAAPCAAAGPSSAFDVCVSAGLDGLLSSAVPAARAIAERFASSRRRRFAAASDSALASTPSPPAALLATAKFAGCLPTGSTALITDSMACTAARTHASSGGVAGSSAQDAA